MIERNNSLFVTKEQCTFLPSKESIKESYIFDIWKDKLARFQAVALFTAAQQPLKQQVVSKTQAPIPQEPKTADSNSAHPSVAKPQLEGLSASTSGNKASMANKNLDSQKPKDAVSPSVPSTVLTPGADVQKKDYMAKLDLKVVEQKGSEARNVKRANPEDQKAVTSTSDKMEDQKKGENAGSRDKMIGMANSGRRSEISGPRTDSSSSSRPNDRTINPTHTPFKPPYRGSQSAQVRRENHDQSADKKNEPEVRGGKASQKAPEMKENDLRSRSSQPKVSSSSSNDVKNSNTKRKIHSLEIEMLK